MDCSKTCKKLEALILTGNSLTSLSADDFKGPLETKSLTHLLISSNNFICDCRIRWLKHTLRQSGIVKYERDRSERCQSPASVKGIRIVDYSPRWIDCDNNDIHLAVIVTSVLTVIAFVIGLLICFRWDIKFTVALHKAKKEQKHRQNEGIEIPMQEHYDAFISYCSDDLEWIKNELIPNLEEAEDIKFRLCISDRDFLPGGAITENIVENLDKSRKAIFLITEQFLNSEWQSFELSMGQVKLFDNRKNMIILLFLEKIDRDDIPKRLRGLMRHVPRLNWPKKENKRRVFWKKLKLLLMATDNEPVLLNAR